MDDEWIYGSSSAQIVASILQGRPNGMPSFRRLLTEQQMWHIAAYVRSMGGQLSKDVPASRTDTLANTPPITLESRQPLYESNQDAGSR